MYIKYSPQEIVEICHKDYFVTKTQADELLEFSVIM